MNTKKANWMFLALVVSHAGLNLLAVRTSLMDAVVQNMALNIIVSEITIWLPAVVFLLVGRTRPAAYCRLKKVHISTALMTVLFTLLLEPLITVVNAFSMLFVDNTVAGLSPHILQIPLWGMLLGIAVYAPFAEELAFRGVIYQSYRQQGNRWRALLLSSLLFGLMHMNLNQACYAFVIGIALALLVEATDSMIPAFIAHACVNGLSTVLMYALDHVAAEDISEIMETAESGLSGESLLLVICLYTVIATVCTPLAGCVLAWIAGREGRREALRELWRSRKEKGEGLMSVPLVLGILVCVTVIVLQLL
ncbi:MAG: CPBP family intramembrane metalloprotease [Lachnospiraceae bacterium]|nr:CPBP family intramembrane metalloprotease [Lachnospiraceae bacterium]